MYYDLLARIKNAAMAGKSSLLAPFSRVDFEVAKVLAKENYLKDVQKKVINRKNFIELKLAYAHDRAVIQGFKVMSKPGRRFYSRYQDLKSVRNGYGLGVLSTSRGIMDNKEAKKNRVGGEYLFEIWK